MGWFFISCISFCLYLQSGTHVDVVPDLVVVSREVAFSIQPTCVERDMYLEVVKVELVHADVRWISASFEVRLNTMLTDWLLGNFFRHSLVASNSWIFLLNFDP